MLALLPICLSLGCSPDEGGQTGQSPMVEQMNGITVVVPENRLSRNAHPYLKRADVGWTQGDLEVPVSAPFNTGLDWFYIDALWPTMAPHLLSNDEAFRDFRKRIMNGSDWLGISISSWLDFQLALPVEQVAERRYEKIVKLGLVFSALESEPVWSRPEYNQALGVTMVRLFGEEAKQNEVRPDSGWRTMVYWSGEAPAAVSTIIYCNHMDRKAAISNSGQMALHEGYCTQIFWMSDLRAEIEIKYDDHLLPHWCAIQDKTTALIRGFYREPGKSGDSSQEDQGWQE